MIALKNIRAGYGDKIVFQNLNITLPERGVLAILGPSGSGKTTLLRLLAGLLQPLSGEITGLAGLRVSMVFQEDRLLPWRTALENVLFSLPREMQGREAAARGWLEKMELAEAADVYPTALSGGMQRRVALARACAYGGDLLLMDEPFKGLDEALRARVAEDIKQAAPLLVMLTHDHEDADMMGAERYFLR